MPKKPFPPLDDNGDPLPYSPTVDDDGNPEPIGESIQETADRHAREHAALIAATEST